MRRFSVRSTYGGSHISPACIEGAVGDGADAATINKKLVRLTADKISRAALTIEMIVIPEACSARVRASAPNMRFYMLWVASNQLLVVFLARLNRIAVISKTNEIHNFDIY